MVFFIKYLKYVPQNRDFRKSLLTNLTHSLNYTFQSSDALKAEIYFTRKNAVLLQDVL